MNERMHQAFAKAHSCLHSFGQTLGLLLEIADLFSHFFLSCRLLGSQALLQSGPPAVRVGPAQDEELHVHHFSFP